ncbi:GNAT family N-acetyltransferase [Nocardia sp. CA-151230]|uniref:GNAT family N-acetyltransferase n=1 Tax=Nocardia sp. CA-151230 TaxID=3239982 RepID=UPI003D906D98
MSANVIQGLTFTRYTAARARGIRDVVEAIYRGAYVDAIDAGDPFEAPDAFMDRFDAYSDPQAGGFELVIGRIDGEPVGQSWGWPLGASSRWWTNLHLDTGDRAAFVAENGLRTFALSEIMVAKPYTGRGIARALHDEILRTRPEERATLLVEPDNARAYRAYINWGWSKVGVLKPSWPNAPVFDALIRELPTR